MLAVVFDSMPAAYSMPAALSGSYHHVSPKTDRDVPKSSHSSFQNNAPRSQKSPAMCAALPSQSSCSCSPEPQLHQGRFLAHLESRAQNEG